MGVNGSFRMTNSPILRGFVEPMSKERTLNPREALERERARLLEEAAAKAAEASTAAAKAAAIDRDMAELDRIAAKYNLTVSGSSLEPQKRADERPATVRTISALAQQYRSSELSPYKKLRFKTREYYDALLKTLLEHCGYYKLGEFKAQHIQQFYDAYTEGGTRRTAMGHSLITMLRGLINFGVAGLADSECERLSVVLHNMKFSVERSSQVKPPTAKQASDIIGKAHEMKMPSIALAQAIQFDCMFSQKDVIGEWVPLAEPGMTEVVHGGRKWLRGVRWEEIDANRVLRHEMSNGGNLVERPLRNASLVVQEFARIGELPKRGPMILCEKTGRPWTAGDFRREWRKIARTCGIPDEVRNMGSREGVRVSARYKDKLKKERPVNADHQSKGRSR
jgi:hypothetical protein